MKKLMRFGVSLDKELLDRFDGLIRKEGYTNRSEAIRDLIRERFTKKEWECDNVVVGAIALIYDHHHGNLLERLAEIQHNYGKVISSFHVHLTHRDCLEIIAVRDKSKNITALAHKIKSLKGIEQCDVAMCGLGEKT
jgi:CopG family nickel-responsive transcriptional regulator